MWNALLQAAPAIIGGLGSVFGRKPDTQKTTMDLVGLVKEARRAGFNPATVLNATGGQGFTKTSYSPTISRLGAAMQVIGEGAGAILGAQNEMRIQEANEKISQANIDNMAHHQQMSEKQFAFEQKRHLDDMGMRDRSFRLAQTTQQRAALGTTVNLTMPSAPQWEKGDVTVTNATKNSKVAMLADAEMFEARYGDIAQEVFGARNAYYDMMINNPEDMAEFDQYVVKPASKGMKEFFKEGARGLGMMGKELNAVYEGEKPMFRFSMKTKGT